MLCGGQKQVVAGDSGRSCLLPDYSLEDAQNVQPTKPWVSSMCVLANPFVLVGIEPVGELQLSNSKQYQATKYNHKYECKSRIAHLVSFLMMVNDGCHSICTYDGAVQNPHFTLVFSEKDAGIAFRLRMLLARMPLAGGTATSALPTFTPDSVQPHRPGGHPGL